VEFLAASMTCDLANTDKVVAAIDEMRRMGIALLPPDVLRSDAEFTVESADGPRGRAKAIRFGLAAIKGLGAAVAEAIVAARAAAERPFGTLTDLCEAVGPTLNRAALEPLLRAGALDRLLPPGGHRAQLAAALEPALRQAAAAHEDRRAGQMSLFGGGPAAPSPAPDPVLPDVPPWTDKEVLAGEKESLGFYLSSHPLARHERTLRALSTAPTNELARQGNGARVWVGGMVTQLRTVFPKSGRNTTRKMARFRLEDFEGSVSCVMFADAYEREGAALADEAIGFVEASVDLSREEPDLRVERFVPVEVAHEELVTTVIVAAPEGEDGRAVSLARRLADEFPGKARLLLDLHPVPRVRALYRVEGRGLRPCAELHEAALAELGEGGVRFKTRKPEARRPAWGHGGGE
jgi:DNA polymerase-3 subunit alpha